MLSSNTSAVSGDANYIEDVFSTYLYTGNGSTQTINNGIDLATKGGLVWTKSRNNGGSYNNHNLVDTARGVSKRILSDLTNAEQTYAGYLTSAFNTNGFDVTDNSAGLYSCNGSSGTYTSWTFRKQPKFFDVVTFTGTGSNLTVNHNLGSVPGMIIVKGTSATSNWYVYHRSLGATKYLRLNATTAETTSSSFWNDTEPTSTTFTIGNNANINDPGVSYVAYIFAHDAGGFGLTGTDNVISCGSFTGLATVNLGYEPQWILYKTSSSANSGWLMVDNMRGFTAAGGEDPYLEANSSAAEQGGNDLLTITSTGFKNNLFAGDTFIYIAIRRGPMKVPTDATKVFRPYIIPINSASATTPINAGLTTDAVFGAHNSDESGGKYFASRLTANYRVNSTSTAVEALGEYYWDNMAGVRQQETNAQPTWYFCKRAPSFFDEVCYTGTGSTTTITHNLGVTPELVITKSRSQALGWVVWTTGLTNTDYWIRLDDTMAQSNSPVGYGGTFSASNYTIANTGPYNALNNSGSTYVAYLFATCAGVSKVGSYTGTGTTKQVDCGFAAGARFVLIKRTDSTGDWYVWDTARGIVSGNDPYLLLNSTAAEVTSTDYIDTYSAGFELSSTAPAALNASGGTFIFFAVA